MAVYFVKLLLKIIAVAKNSQLRIYTYVKTATHVAAEDAIIL